VKSSETIRIFTYYNSLRYHAVLYKKVKAAQKPDGQGHENPRGGANGNTHQYRISWPSLTRQLWRIYNERRFHGNECRTIGRSQATLSGS
jgi:hypothetical protein